VRLLAPQAGASLLDVGCGSGWFTRRAAADDLVATGLDPIPYGWIRACAQQPGLELGGRRSRALPFADASFDHVLSIAALCFVDDERQAVAESVRVARRRLPSLAQPVQSAVSAKGQGQRQRRLSRRPLA